MTTAQDIAARGSEPFFIGDQNTLLREVVWYKQNNCPPGFYDTIPNPFKAAEFSECFRCPDGTEKLKFGGLDKDGECEPCAKGYSDHDLDPATACEELAVFVIGTHPRSVQDAGKKYHDPVANTAYAVGESYLIAPLKLDPDTTQTVENDTFADITYKMTGAPQGFFLNPQSGEVFGQFNNASDERNISLFAVDLSGQEALVEVYRMVAKLKDTDSEDKGPGGKGCGAVGKKVDATPFDGQFTCDCTGTLFEGWNCKKDRSCDEGAFVRGVCKNFTLVHRSDRQSETSGRDVAYIDPIATAKVAVGDSFLIARLQIDVNKTMVSDGDISDISFSLKDASIGFFINSDTGTIAAQFLRTDADRNFTMTMMATDR